MKDAPKFWKALLRRKLFLAGAGLFILLGIIASVPDPLVRVLARLLPNFVWFVETSQPVVALTFDDGPNATYTPQVLELLAKHQVHATFFLIGENARMHPDLVERIRTEGHEIGNHFDRRGPTLFLSAQDFEKDLVRAEVSIGLVPAGNPDSSKSARFFRPPGGFIRPTHRSIAERRGYISVLGSAYAFDPHGPPRAYLEWAISKNLRPGAIVILHDAGGDRSTNIAALPTILDAAKTKGLRWVTLTELLHSRQ